MALTKCTDCGHRISTQAAACPNCGAPPPPQTTPLHEVLREAAGEPGAVRAAAGVFRTFIKGVVVVMGLGVVVIGIAIGIASRDSDKPKSSEAEQPPPLAQQTPPNEAPAPQNEAPPVAAAPAIPAAPPIELSTDELYDEYRSNEVVADQKYKGKIIEVSGNIYSITKDIVGDISVVMETSHPYTHVQLIKVPTDTAVKLKKGDNIKATCIGAGMIIDTPVLRCGT